MLEPLLFVHTRIEKLINVYQTYLKKLFGSHFCNASERLYKKIGKINSHQGERWNM